MNSLSQEHDDQELLDQQLHDTLFDYINDVPSSDRVSASQEQTLSGNDLFFPGDDMMDDPPAAADESTGRMGIGMSASPAPSTMTQTTPAAAHVETPSMGYVPSASPTPISMTQTTPAGQVL